MGTCSIRPKKWLFSRLVTGVWGLFKKKRKVVRKAQDRKAFQDQYTRAFVVDFPEDSSVDQLPRQQPAARFRSTPRSTNSPPILEPQTRYQSCISCPSTREAQPNWVPRPPRQRTPVAERIPARQGRRLFPDRSGLAGQPMPSRMNRYDWVREVDRGSVEAFRRVPLPQTGRRTGATPRRSATTAREGQRRPDIPISARRNFPHPECVPQPLRLIHRSPRPQQETTRPRASARGVALEERRPRNGIRIEERWPRPYPGIAQDGYFRHSAAGNRILEQTRQRPMKIVLEVRRPRWAV